MPKQDRRKSDLKHSYDWMARDGQTLQLCVPCELSTKPASVQASVVFLGVSLCLEHLHTVKELLLKSYEPELINKVIIEGML